MQVQVQVQVQAQVQVQVQVKLQAIALERLDALVLETAATSFSGHPVDITFDN